MSWWMLALGVVLLGVATYDAITTTISVSTRSGPLTSAVNKVVSTLAHGGALDRTPRLLRAAGTFAVVAAVTAWILTLWAGWTLVFSADPGAVVSATTGTPVDAVGRWLFSAYTTYTLGYGNYLPTGNWQIVASVALIVGFALFTLSVTYAIPVVSAVTARRSQAALLATTGTTTEEVVETLHDANGFGALDELLTTLTPTLLLTAQQHLAYPVLHNFLSVDRRSALAPGVAALDDAITLLDVAVEGSQRPNRAFTAMWRDAVDQLLDLITKVGDGSGQEVPPLPSLDVLDRLGIAHVDEATYRSRMQAEDQRRQRLCTYVRSTRWDWPGT